MAPNSKESHPDNAAYWACQFPRLGTGDGRSKRSMSLRVTLEHGQKLQQLSVSDEAALPSLLRVAWALLLRCYTGLDHVCFGYQETGPGTVGINGPPISGPLNGMHVAHFTMDDMVSVADTLEKAKGECISGLPHQNLVPSGRTRDPGSSDSQLFDTAVVLRNFSDSAARNDTGVTLQPLKMVSLEEVCTRSFPETSPTPPFII